MIVITGASSGIGAAAAVACAAEGMHVVLSARREERLRQVAAACTQAGRARGGGGEIVVADVCDRLAMFGLVDDAAQRHGRLDAVFANAGYGIGAPVDKTTIDQARAIFETNFFGTLHVVQAAVPHMRRQGRGHILICSSAASEIAPPYYGLYAATKAAQDAIACAMRAELAGEGVDLTSIHPIGTRTEFGAVVETVSDTVYRPRRNTPDALRQPVEKVARKIVAALRRPRAEVWPSPVTRVLLGLLTACPSLSAMVMRRMMRRYL